MALILATLLTDYFILNIWLFCLAGGIFLSIIFIKGSSAKQEARITLLMVPLLTTTTINFVRKNAQLGTFYVKAGEQRGSDIVTFKPLSIGLVPLLPLLPRQRSHIWSHLHGWSWAPRGSIFFPPYNFKSEEHFSKSQEHLFIGHSFGSLKAWKINLMEHHSGTSQSFEGLLGEFVNCAKPGSLIQRRWWGLGGMMGGSSPRAQVGPKSSPRKMSTKGPQFASQVEGSVTV